jgi:hypothetical protein
VLAHYFTPQTEKRITMCEFLARWKRKSPAVSSLFLPAAAILQDLFHIKGRETMWLSLSDGNKRKKFLYERRGISQLHGVQ